MLGLRQRDGRVVGASVRNELTGEDMALEAQVVVNASGAWAGQIAAMADCEVAVIPGKGIMIAMNHRLVSAVINRCKLPDDGDILVPIRTVCVIGTTDSPVADPDELDITAAEVQEMLDEGEKLVPGFRRARALRAWAGARPLFEETRIGRRHARRQPLAHRSRPRAPRRGRGLPSRSPAGRPRRSGAWPRTPSTPSARSSGSSAPAGPPDEPLPGSEEGRHYRLGARLAAREPLPQDEEIVCECELITRGRLEESIARRGTESLDDLRRQVRLGMGPCQGGFCSYRATGILHGRRPARLRVGEPRARSTSSRSGGKASHPILYGDQAAPGTARRLDLPGRPRRRAPARMTLDTVVVGTGLAGLCAALRLADEGQRVLVVARGVGATRLAPATDRRSRLPPERVDEPGARAGRACPRPGHPYARLGPEVVSAGLAWLRERGPQLGYAGSLARTCSCPPPSACGRRRSSQRRSPAATCAGAAVAFVGFAG